MQATTRFRFATLTGYPWVMARSELTIQVSEKAGSVSALLEKPRGARALYAFAHGAGAGMKHAFMEAACAALAERGVATLRYQFPFTEAGKRRPDSKGILLATVRAAVETARSKAGALPLFVGGKSMGGRMTSQAAAEEALPGVSGIVFYGFPLHPTGKPGIERADHLAEIDLPMLFLQGTRDTLADLELLKPVCRKLGSRSTLHVVDGADHSFHVLKRSGRTDEEVLTEISDQLVQFVDRYA